MEKSNNAIICTILIMFVVYSPLIHATQDLALKETTPQMPFESFFPSRSALMLKKGMFTIKNFILFFKRGSFRNNFFISMR